MIYKAQWEFFWKRTLLDAAPLSSPQDTATPRRGSTHNACYSDVNVISVFEKGIVWQRIVKQWPKVNRMTTTAKALRPTTFWQWHSKKDCRATPVHQSPLLVLIPPPLERDNPTSSTQPAIQIGALVPTHILFHSRPAPPWAYVLIQFISQIFCNKIPFMLQATIYP